MPVEAYGEADDETATGCWYVVSVVRLVERLAASTENELGVGPVTSVEFSCIVGRHFCWYVWGRNTQRVEAGAVVGLGAVGHVSDWPAAPAP